MGRAIAIIQGHPDPKGKRLCHALADAYSRGARIGGHRVRRIEVGRIAFPVLRRAADWAAGPLPDSLAPAQEAIGWADHLVIVYPLWLGTMPALLKAFLEQVARPGFAVEVTDGGKGWTPGLKGKSARVVVTMGMPAPVYRWYFGAHSLKSLERNILKFSGVRPVRETLFGLVESAGRSRRRRWIETMERLGRAGE